MTQDIVRTSKFLSLVLRHQPEIGFGCANYGDTSALQPAHDACSAGAKTG